MKKLLLIMITSGYIFSGDPIILAPKKTLQERFEENGFEWFNSSVKLSKALGSKSINNPEDIIRIIDDKINYYKILILNTHSTAFITEDERRPELIKLILQDYPETLKKLEAQRPDIFEKRNDDDLYAVRAL